MRHALVVFGTRPEAIKMAPVVRALRAHGGFTVTVCVTGQHREMLDQVLAQFDLTPDVDLNLMSPGQTLGALTARVLRDMPAVLADANADVVIVQGDTTTAMATAMAAFYARIEIAHVEAGLRSGRLDAPYPEELNRIFIDQAADYLYPPTRRAADAIARDGRQDAQVLLTGNTAIDALLDIRDRLDVLDLPIRDTMTDVERLVLVTAHRRESFGEPLRQVMGALKQLASEHRDVTFVYPAHPNPHVLEAVRALEGVENIRCIKPVGYGEMVWLLDKAELVLTDSGGIQEEAPTLGTPVLVLREVTERQEIVEAGAGELVGTDPDRILRSARHVLAGHDTHRGGSPRFLFGDGHAAERIAEHLAGDDPAAWQPDPLPTKTP